MAESWLLRRKMRFLMLANGAYTVRIFGSPDGPKLASDEFDVCFYSEERGLDCERA